MTYQLKQVAKDLADAIQNVEQQAKEQAVDELFEDAGGLVVKALTGRYDISTALAGIDWSVQDGDEPLTLYILDLLAEQPVIFKADPIGDCIEGSMNARGEHVYCESALASLRRAIYALESGIGRLKEHEALLLSLQP